MYSLGSSISTNVFRTTALNTDERGGCKGGWEGVPGEEEEEAGVVHWPRAKGVVACAELLCAWEGPVVDLGDPEHGGHCEAWFQM
mmetsp:Transcript_52893/g.164293  ORF Transcript_52893/g.164293 Transcript_52893/m.164293 type:complete len:85 (+) Transcript_52893:157-411(+)